MDSIHEAVSGSVEYRGRMSDGVPVIGVRPAKGVTTFGKQCWRAGWRELTVTANGREVARIERDAARVYRIWWAEA